METKCLSSPQGPRENLVFYAKPVETALGIIHVGAFTIGWMEIAPPSGVVVRSHVSQAFGNRVARCIELPTALPSERTLGYQSGGFSTHTSPVLILVAHLVTPCSGWSCIRGFGFALLCCQLAPRQVNPAF
jgi:hypothetical protein